MLEVRQDRPVLHHCGIASWGTTNSVRWSSCVQCQKPQNSSSSYLNKPLHFCWETPRCIYKCTQQPVSTDNASVFNQWRQAGQTWQNYISAAGVSPTWFPWPLCLSAELSQLLLWRKTGQKLPQSFFLHGQWWWWCHFPRCPNLGDQNKFCNSHNFLLLNTL